MALLPRRQRQAPVSYLKQLLTMYSKKKYIVRMADITKVVWSKQVAKQLDKLPDPIVRKFYAWVTSISLSGVLAVRKSLGFHDEPLKGKRQGQRSIEAADGKLEHFNTLGYVLTCTVMASVYCMYQISKRVEIKR